VFLPLSHPPGEAQVDFGDAAVRIAEKERKAAIFVMALPSSGAMFVQAFPKECTETFMEGHRRAFEEFGSVPRRITYDNSGIAVIEVLKGRERKLTKEFFQLQSHSLFTAHFCRVRGADEKGHVERLLGTARKRFLVPVPNVDSFETLNRHLIESCRRAGAALVTRWQAAPPACRWRRPLSPPTSRCSRRCDHEQDRDQERGAAQATEPTATPPPSQG
jgi:transposase